MGCMRIMRFFRMNKGVEIRVQVQIPVASLSWTIHIVKMITLKVLLVENCTIGT